MLIVGLANASILAQTKEGERAAKWEKEIAALEKKQAEKPPVKGGIVFAGSSTIRLWDIGKAFPDWHATNSGFGGSEIRDVTHFAERLVIKHEPRAIVFYAGDNESTPVGRRIRSSPTSRAFARRQKYGARKPASISSQSSRAHPGGRSTRPSPGQTRWSRSSCERRTLDYVDVVTLLLGMDGQPREELYVKDKLHLSPAGYEVLNEAVRKAVK